MKSIFVQALEITKKDISCLEQYIELASNKHLLYITQDSMIFNQISKQLNHAIYKKSGKRYMEIFLKIKVCDSIIYLYNWEFTKNSLDILISATNQLVFINTSKQKQKMIINILKKGNINV